MSTPSHDAGLTGTAPVETSLSGGSWERLAASASGAPDPVLIAQLANELFAAWPGPAWPTLSSPGPQPVVPDVTAPSTSSFQASSPQTPVAPPVPSAVPVDGGAPSVPPTVPPVGPTMASPSVFPSDAELRLVPVLHAGTATAIPPVSSSPPVPSTTPQAPRPTVDLPIGIGGIPALASTAVVPDLGLPNVMPTGEQLSLVPRSHASVMAGLPDLGVPLPTVPGEPNWFLDEGKAGATTVPAPLRIESLELGPESLSYDPNRLPDLGFAARPFDPRAVRRDFPILEEKVHGRRLIWLDNAATTQKPNAVIDRVSDFYRHENSNIHRAAHALAAKATDAYEAAREKVRRFLNAGASREIVFVRGTTEGINLVSQAFGRRYVGEGDEIVVTHLEHHANIVPWQMLCSEKKARLRVVPVDDRGQVILEEYEKLLGPRTRIVAVSQVSNALGTVVPVQAMTEMAHRHGARVLVDGAQSVSHMPVDVQSIGCDFFVFSGHKVFGPTGIGAVYGRSDVLDATPPWQGGGNMIADVTFERTVYQPAPFKFEAGTGTIADAVGLGAALDYVLSVGRENIARYEHELLEYMTKGLLTVPGLRIIGTAAEKAGVVSFVLDGFRTEDVGAALDQEGIAVRSGHHCAQPILRRFGLESTVRPSLAPYNTCEDIEALVSALLRLQAGRGHRGL